MDNHPHDLRPGRSRPPCKELQGPRPALLKVRKDSFKIKKPPVAPPVHHQLPPQQPPRQPVIIYTVSPKVIHADPSEFMTVVQRLTGHDSTTSTSSSATSSSSSSTFQFPCFSSVGVHSVGISPAVRFASIEQTKLPQEDMKVSGPSGVMEGEMVEISGGGGREGAERTGLFPAGILSPGPGSLPPISPNFFSPFFNDPSSSHINLHHHHEFMSGVQHQPSARNYMEISHINLQNNPFSTNNFTFPSPSTTFSPSSLDLLRRILDN